MYLTMMESVQLLYLNHHVHGMPSMQVTENKQISQAVCPRECTIWGKHNFQKEDSVTTLWEWGRAASAAVAIRCFFVELECELRARKMAQWSRAGSTLQGLDFDSQYHVREFTTTSKSRFRGWRSLHRHLNTCGIQSHRHIGINKNKSSQKKSNWPLKGC